MCFPSALMIFSTTLLLFWTPKKLLTTFDPCISYWTLIYLTIWTWTFCIDWNMAGSVRTCCVPNCAKTRADNIVLHAFPDPEKEENRFVTWVKAVGGSISSLDYKYIHKNRKICHDHFEEKYLTWSRRLSSGAVPTLHMPGFQIERVVLKEVTNICNKGLTEINNSTTSPKYTLEDYRMAPSSSANIGTHIAASHLEPVVASTSADLTLKPETTILKDIVAVKQSLKVKRKDTKFLDDTKVLKQMVDKLTQKKNKYASRLKKALKLTENSTFQKILNKSTSLAAIFFTMQFREVRKMKMGRRFTEQEKIMALSIYKQGPKCYRLLSKIFVLPSPLTLSRLIKQVDLRAGINEKLFDVMMKKIKNMNTDEKLCILLFDEIAISPHFEYNQRKDAISGFVTNGTTIQNKIADHALVFMIRGVLRNYKQPVAYTFCAGSTKKEELAVLIKTVIKKLHSVGLRVLATVCDQGASNVSCIKYLIAETRSKYLKINQELKRDVFEVEDKEIIPLYDPPHLIKGVRNNLIDKNLKCTINASSKTAKWQHIINLYKEDPSYSGIKLLKNLTEEHINPEKCKMKVKFATQVFSQKVASTMGYLASKEILPKECQETADVLLFFDELFDSVNGSKENSEKRRGKPLLCALTPNSSHNAIWAKAKTVLSSMKFLKNGKELNIPTVSNWLHTINNFEYLRDVLFNNYKMKSIWTRHYNQDPLENFFGAIRSHGCRNINPSPEGFEIAFASLLISNLTGTHSPGSNCEQDTCKNMFKSIKDIFKVSERNNMSQSIDLSYMPSNIFVAYEDKKKDPRILAQLEYVTGYLLRKTKKHVFNNCISCKGILFNKQEDNEYLRAREFTKKRQLLEYPSEALVRMFSGIQDILMWVLKNHSNIENIKMFTKTILYMEIDTNFITCEKHKKQNTEYIFDLGCRFFIHNWCREINNILKGRRKDAVGDDYIKNLALQYVNKRRKCNYK